MGLTWPRRRHPRRDEPVLVGEHDVLHGRAARWYLHHEYAVIYVVSGTVYVLVGMRVTFLINWIVGPLWPVACIWLGPMVVRRVTGWQDPLP